MSQIIRCPQCEKSVRAPEAALGKKIRCSACQSVFVAGAEKTVAASPSAKRSVTRYLLPPAIGLLITGILGLGFNLYQVGVALVAPQMFKEIPFAQGISPTYSAAVGFIFATVAIVIVAGAICMMRRKAYGLAMTGTILAMVNIGNACCVLGLPIGIWALFMLWRADVKDAFGLS